MKPFEGNTSLKQVAVAEVGVLPPLSESEFSKELVTHYPDLLRFARFFTRNPVSAEDLAQDTMVRALQARESYIPQEGRNMRPWLCVILRNKFFVDERKARQRRKRDFQYASQVERENADRFIHPDTRFSLKAVVDGIFAELPEHERETMLLLIDDSSYGEIAETLQVAEGTVKSRVHRARATLSQLAGCEDAEKFTTEFLAPTSASKRPPPSSIY